MTAACLDCGSTFQARGDWQRRCWNCWRDHKEATDTDAAYDRGYRAGWAAAGHAPVSDAAPLDERLLRDLIGLAHPDRHPPERAQQANTATAALLSLLANYRKVAA